MKRGMDGGSGGGGKKMRGDNVTLRFLLLSKHAGGIIGKGGQTIKRLRADYNATVNVPDSSTQERVLSISATQENCIKVLLECLPLFHEPPYPVGGNQGQQQGNFEIDFLVHSSQVGGVIGRGGFKIKELREATGANIKVYQECLPNSTERVVALGGGEDEIMNVLNKILEIMQESPIKGNITLYDPSQEPWNGPNDNFGGPPMGMNMGGGGNMGRGGMRGGMRGGRGGNQGGGRGGFQGGYQGGPGGNFGGGNRGGGGNFNGPMGGGNMNNSGYGGNVGGYGGGNGGFGGNNGNFGGNNMGGGFGGNDFGNQNFNYQGNQGNQNQGDFGGGDTQTTQVTIPNDLAGAIIGKGGERIRNIRTRSGADIKISDPMEGKSDRIITITGNQEQIQYAQFLMQQSVRQYSGKPSK